MARPSLPWRRRERDLPEHLVEERRVGLSEEALGGGGAVGADMKVVDGGEGGEPLGGQTLRLGEVSRLRVGTSAALARRARRAQRSAKRAATCATGWTWPCSKS